MHGQMMTAFDGYDWFLRTRKGISAGDVIAVPLKCGGFGFGRVLNVHDGATLAEFFAYWSEEASFDQEIIESPRLFSPVGISVMDIEYRNRKRDWKVIHRDSELLSS